MDSDKRAKAALVTLGAMFGAIAANPWFLEAARAICGVLAVGCGALLGYLLNPKAGPPSGGVAVGPISTDSVTISTSPSDPNGPPV